jgi:hypothetical protein
MFSIGPTALSGFPRQTSDDIGILVVETNRILRWALWSSACNKGGKAMEYQIEQELGFEYEIEQEEGPRPEHNGEDADIQPINQWEPPDYFLG